VLASRVGADPREAGPAVIAVLNVVVQQVGEARRDGGAHCASSIRSSARDLESHAGIVPALLTVVCDACHLIGVTLVTTRSPVVGLRRA
jgi:hypothetical protein